jgi:probable F420-dependent oxidoreductase
MVDGEVMTSRDPELSLYLQTFTDGPQHDWRRTLAYACAMDEAGVDRVVVSDHVVFGENLEAYADASIGGQAGGRQPTGPDGSWLEPLTVLTAIAATTSRIRLGTAILLAALRRPAVLAKQLATLDVLSDGRIDLGVGVGWQREEYDAAGLSFEDRGRLLDHTLEVCQTLWTQQRASYQSEELTFERIHQMPKPVQPGGVPVWVSGTVNNAVARRIARFGSGWIPWGPAYADMPGSIAAMKDKVRGFGGDPTDLQVQGVAKIVKRDDGSTDFAASAATAVPLVEAGVTDVRFPAALTVDGDRAVEMLSLLVEAFRDATR